MGSRSSWGLNNSYQHLTVCNTFSCTTGSIYWFISSPEIFSKNSFEEIWLNSASSHLYDRNSSRSKQKYNTFLFLTISLLEMALMVFLGLGRVRNTCLLWSWWYRVFAGSFWLGAIDWHHWWIAQLAILVSWRDPSSNISNYVIRLEFISFLKFNRLNINNS